MKDSKTSLLLTVSIILFVISLGLMSAGIYYYFKDRDAELAKGAQKNGVVKKAPVSATRDSLKKDYKEVIHQLDASENLVKKNPEDSSNLNAKSKLQEVYQLRDEIPSLLTDKSSVTQMDSARKKITLLQLKVNSLKIKSDKAALENQQLTASINKLKSQIKKTSATNNAHVSESVSTPKPKAFFTVLNTRVWAEDNTGTQTSLAQQAQKMVGTFTIRKREEPPGVNEVFIIIIQPDGSVLKNLNWESGIFETAEGRKIYSTKIVFEYNKETSKQLNFKVSNESFQKGEYQFHIYQNGYSIGRGSTKLS